VFVRSPWFIQFSKNEEPERNAQSALRNAECKMQNAECRIVDLSEKGLWIDLCFLPTGNTAFMNLIRNSALCIMHSALKNSVAPGRQSRGNFV
jgi:Tfp pilus assembly protein PilX